MQQLARPSPEPAQKEHSTQTQVGQVATNVGGLSVPQPERRERLLARPHQPQKRKAARRDHVPAWPMVSRPFGLAVQFLGVGGLGHAEGEGRSRSVVFIEYHTYCSVFRFLPLS